MQSLLFPGQSSQFTGMSLDFYERYQIIKELFKNSSDIIGFDIKKIIEGEPSILNDTSYLQVCLFIACISTFEVAKIEQKIQLDQIKYLAGHSLGEYMALYVAEAISLEDVLKILKKRSYCMANANKNHPNKQLSMASVLGVDFDTLNKILNDFLKLQNTEQDLFIANYNTNSQIVLSGSLKSIEEFKNFSKEKIRKIINLPVSSAFHSIFMNEAKEEFADFMKNFKIKDAKINIVMNNTALPEKNGEKIKNNLIENLVTGVKWWSSILYMIENGTTDFMQIGGKEILTNMMKKENLPENIKISFFNSCSNL